MESRASSNAKNFEEKGFANALAQLTEKLFTCFIYVDSNIIVITINIWYEGQGILMINELV